MLELPVHMTLAAGTYQLTRCVGQGSTGCVYAAAQVPSGSAAAIKLLLPHLAADLSAHVRFRLGAAAAARIDHPHVVKIRDFGTLPNGLAYTLMELLHGPTLRQHLRVHECLPVAHALKIIAQVAAALGAAHEQNIVHGDLTPANILLHYDDEGALRCKVVDFGIAGSPTGADTIIGTPRYMAPEHYAGKAIDIRSDIFSLGVILYEMLAGVAPYPGATPREILQQHRRLLPNLKDSCPELPAPLHGLVATALSLDPDSRWRTPAIFAREVTLLQDRLARETSRWREATPTQTMDETIEIEDTTEELSYLEDLAVPATRQVDRATSQRSVEVLRMPRPARLQPSLLAAPSAVLAAALIWLFSGSPSDQIIVMPSVTPSPQVPREAMPIPKEAAPLPFKTTPIASTALPASEPSRHADHDVPAHAALLSALDGWIAATNSRDLEGQLAFYPSTLDRFYLWHDVSRKAVLAEKRRVFERADLIDIRAGTPEVSVDSGGRTARMQFRKQYVIQSARGHRQGEVLQELRWVNDAGAWKIFSERDLKVIS